MKISIWQQFSSNHSSDFQIVGKFETLDAAQQGVRTLRELLRHIREAREGYSNDAPTEVEMELARQYQVNWELSLDWIFDENANVVQFDQVVFCGNLEETRTGMYPLDQILPKWGWDILVQSESVPITLVVDLACSSTSSDVADSIVEECTGYFKRVRDETASEDIPPWREFSRPIYPVPDFPDMPFEYDDLYFGYIRRSDYQLIFSKMVFSEIGYGLPAFLAYLRTKGCENIEYRIKERAMWDVE